jgi:hypothetical protein
MWHVLLLILKIILVIIAVVLGIVLLALLAVLFVPIRYRIGGQYNENEKFASAKCSWLLHILSVSAGFDKENGADFAIRLFGIRLNRKKKKADETGGEKANKKRKKEKNVFDEDEQEETRRDSKTKSDRCSETHIESRTEVVTAEKSDDLKSDKQDLARDAAEQDVESTESTESVGSAKNVENADNIENAENTEKTKSSPLDKLKGITTKIQDFFKNLSEKKEKLSAALNNEDYRELAAFLWGQVKALLRLIKPKKGRLYVHYGFDDVETTGKVTMYAAILYGIIGADVKILPDFENKVFEGDAYIKGHIRLIGVARIALRCYFNKNFKKYILNK